MSVDQVIAALPPSVRARLEAAGAGSSELESTLQWPESEAVLLTGSTSDELSTAASDLDFIVLRGFGEPDEPIEQMAERRGLPPEAVQATALLHRILTFVNGIEMDVWVVSSGRLAQLAGTLASSVNEDGTVRSLPGLQYIEQKLLCRLYNSVVLQGQETFDRWRAYLHIERLPVLLTAGMLVDTWSYLEDAVSIVEPRDQGGLGSSLGSFIAARAAAERLVHASLTSAGVIGWDLRYAEVHRRRIEKGGGRLPQALVNLEALLFPDVPAGEPEREQAARRYNALVLEQSARLVAEIRERPELGEALAFLRVFSRGRWQLDVGFVEG